MKTIVEETITTPAPATPRSSRKPAKGPTLSHVARPLRPPRPSCYGEEGHPG